HAVERNATAAVESTGVSEGRTAPGKRTQKVLPRGSLSDTQISPPWAVTISRQIVRPRPTPFPCAARPIAGVALPRCEPNPHVSATGRKFHRVLEEIVHHLRQSLRVTAEQDTAR